MSGGCTAAAWSDLFGYRISKLARRWAMAESFLRKDVPA
jgi:hypothetical protein